MPFLNSLTPKTYILIIDIHEENKPNFNFDLFKVKEVNMTSATARSDYFEISKGIKKKLSKTVMNIFLAQKSRVIRL